LRTSIQRKRLADATDNRPGCIGRGVASARRRRCNRRMRWYDRLMEWVAVATPASRLATARRLVREGHHAAAERVFSPLLDVRPIDLGLSPAGYAAVLCEVGECALANDKPADAEGIFRRALSEAEPTANAPRML